MDISMNRIGAVEANYYEGFDGLRDYYSPLGPHDHKNIHFIVTTLADKSYLSLLIQKHAIEVAGDKIEHVHPLRLLLHIFQNEELKVSMRNIKGIPWDEFSKGLKDSLQEEHNKNNIQPDFIEHFCKELELEQSRMESVINSCRWDELLDILKDIPRKGDYRRYDM